MIFQGVVEVSPYLTPLTADGTDLCALLIKFNKLMNKALTDTGDLRYDEVKVEDVRLVTLDQLHTPPSNALELKKLI